MVTRRAPNFCFLYIKDNWFVEPSTKSLSLERLPPWHNSHAKKLLIKDIIDGNIDGMEPKRVFVMQKEYQAYKYENFATNLQSLRKQVAEKQSLADDDEAAFAHDEMLGLQVNSIPYLAGRDQ